ncbi:MAG: PAS domain S-box protein [Elusimicrobia bacterium]|nr:PAS domain S-box protein [Elusimicrobiota bacterium]
MTKKKASSTKNKKNEFILKVFNQKIIAAEQVLSKQNILLKSIINSRKGILIFALDKNYCYMIFNERHRKEMKKVYNANIKLGKCMLDYITIPEVKPIAKASFDRVLNGESFIEIQKQPDLNMYYEFNWSPLKLSNGNIVGINVFIQDITNRKHAEEELKESENKYHAIFEKAPIGITHFDMNGVITSCNTRLIGILGTSIKNIIGFNMQTGVKDIQAKAAIHEVLSGKIGHFEGEYVSVVSGKSIMIKNVYSPLFSEDGLLLGGICITEDITERKKAKENIIELLNSETKFRILFESSQDAIMTLEPPSWNFTSGNPATIKMFGVKNEKEFISFPPWKLSPEFQPDGQSSNDKAKKMIEIAVLKGSNFFEWTHRRLSGEDFSATVLLTKLEHKGKELIQATVRDISTQKKVEQNMLESENKYRSLFENSNAAILITDTETGIILDANKKAEELFGRNRQEIIGMNRSKIHPLDEAEYYDKHFRNHIEKRSVDYSEATIIKKNGTQVPVQIGAVVMEIQGKKVIQGIFQDITERKKAEEILKKSAKEWQDTFDSAKDSITLISSEQRLLKLNKAACKSFGKTQEELLGKKCYEIMHGTDSPIKNCPCISALETGLECEVEIEEHGRAYLVSASPVFDDNNKLTLFVQIVKDITEHKMAEAEKLKLQAQILQSGKMAAIGQLASGVVHEINNPIGVILGFTQSIVKDIKEDDNLYKSLKSIEREAIRCKEFVRNMLTFSRVGQTEKVISNINEVIEQSISLVEAQTKVKNIQIIKSYGDNLPQIPVNKSQIQQVIINLSNNAIDAMPQGGSLTIATTQITADEKTQMTADKKSAVICDKKSVVISVTDTGSGMTEEVKKHLFEAFYTTKEAGKGTGLGLSLCYEIIQKHNGTIEAESEVGKGTTFKVKLPIG